MLNHKYEIIEPKHWTDVVSPRSKLSMHFLGLKNAWQSAGVPESGVIHPADLVLEPCRQDRWRWRIPDGTVEYLCSKAIWVELKNAGGIGWKQLRMHTEAQRRIWDRSKRDLYDRIVDPEGPHILRTWSVTTVMHIEVSKVGLSIYYFRLKR